MVSLQDALDAARTAGLDLVQVMPGDLENPPVCRLMDYGKFKYRQKRRTHQSKTKSHATNIKEIRLHPKTSQHDIDYRLAHAREFLTKGDKVLITVVFTGRELAHVESGEGVLLRVAAQLEDAGRVETPPKREGRRMAMMLVPK